MMLKLMEDRLHINCETVHLIVREDVCCQVLRICVFPCWCCYVTGFAGDLYM